MELVRSLVKSLLAFLLFETMIGQLLENTAYEKYAKLYTGLLLILIMLSPLISAFKLWDTLNWNVDFELMNQERFESSADFQISPDARRHASHTVENAENLERKMEDLERDMGIEKQYKIQLSSQLAQWFSQRNASMEECKIKINEEDGTIEKINISYAGDEKIKEEAVSMLNITLGIKEESISIKNVNNGG